MTGNFSRICILALTVCLLPSSPLAFQALEKAENRSVRDAEEGRSFHKPADNRKSLPPALQKPSFAPGQIIVRFADTAPVGTVAAELVEQGQNFSDITGIPGLDNLNDHFRLKSARRVFPGTSTGRTRLPSGPLTPEAAVELHHQALERFSARVFATRNSLIDRGRRVPPNAVVPFLDSTYVLEFEDPGISVEEAARAYGSDPSILYAQPNYMNEINYVPDDPYYHSSGSWGQPYDDLWGIKKLDPEPAWNVTMGNGVVVAVIDTGVDGGHPDLAANMWVNAGETPGNGIDDDANGFIDDYHGWDFSDWDNDPSDYQGHGTHVSGTVAAVGGNGLGVIGVAPQARIMAVKGFPDATDTVMAGALRYAADNGAAVINNSWGPGGRRPSSPLIEDAVDYAWGLGCVLVFSAGNNNDDVAHYSPANRPNTIAVAAVDRNDERSDFSNYGELVDVAAPGGDSSFYSPDTYEFLNILSLRAAGTDMYGNGFGVVGDDYIRLRGTSMAAPHVSGVAALVVAGNPGRTPQEVRDILVATAEDIAPFHYQGSNHLIGAGMVQASSALAGKDHLARFTGLEVMDDLPGNNVNGTLDPGETAHFVVTLKNWASDLHNVTARLTAEDPRVTVVQEESTYGDIGRGATALNDAEPFTVSLHPSDSFENLEFLLVISSDEADLDSSFTYLMSFSHQHGWPKLVEADFQSQPVIADIDPSVPGKEIVTMPTGRGGIGNPGLDSLQVWSAEGVELWRVDQVRGDFKRGLHPAVGDLDGDGDLEVVVTVRFSHGNLIPLLPPLLSKIYAWNHDGTLLPGMDPYIMPLLPEVAPDMDRDEPKFGSPVLGDLDGDGDLEVIFMVSTFDSLWLDRREDTPMGIGWGGVQAIHHDGTPVEGFPFLAERWTMQNGIPYDWVGMYQSAPSIANIDGAGDPEVVACSRDGRVFAIDSGGGLLPGWPVFTGGDIAGSTPAVGDLDPQHPGLETVVGSWDTQAWAFHADGTIVDGWPVSLGDKPVLSSPALADFDGDGLLEVAIGGDGSPYIIRNDGTYLEGWPPPPHAVMRFSSPAVADLSGDGKPDLAIGSDSGKLYFWDSEGFQLEGSPVDLGGDNMVTPAVGDLDGDGDVEVVQHSVFGFMESEIHVLDLPHPVDPSPAPWPMYQRDARRSGSLPAADVPPPLLLEVTGSGSGAVEVSGRRRDLPWSGEFTPGWAVSVLARPESGWYFDGWAGDWTGATNPADFTIDAPTALNALFGECVDLDEAADTTPGTLTTGGSGSWCGRSVLSAPDGDAAASGSLGYASESWMQAAVEGPVTVRFRWKVSSEEGYDFLTFALDGEPLESISGETGWQDKSFDIPAGWHIVTWTYRTDYKVSAGENRAWVDRIENVIPVPDLGSTLDAPSLTWITGGAADWFPQRNVFHTGGWAGESGIAEHNEESWVETTVDGPALLGFQWRVSSEEVYDSLVLEVDGQAAGEISGETGWEKLERYLQPGPHVLRWAYRKDGSVSDGADRGWLDSVEVTGSGPVSLSLSAVGSGSVEFYGVEVTLPWTGEFAHGQQVELKAISADGWRFDGWSGDHSGSVNPSSILLDTSKAVTVSFSEFGIPLGAALDGTGMTWTTGGASVWYGQDSIFQIGGSSAASGTVGLGEESWVEATVDGPALVSFLWKVSSEEECDFLVFEVDGSTVMEVSGEVGWRREEHFLPAGSHLVRWAYRKDGSIDDGADRGWLDSVEVTPESMVSLSISASGGGRVLVDGIERILPWSGDFFKGHQAVLEALPDDGWNFSGWSGDLSGSVNPAPIVLNADRSVSASFVAGISLAEALDSTSLTWTTAGDGGWRGQGAVHSDSADAAESSNIGHGQEAVLETTVTGEGTVSFWWKVSSGESYDVLTFSIDGEDVYWISGEVGWHQVSRSFTTGDHVLSWAYRKDGHNVGGADRGWVDRVEIRPGIEPPSHYMLQVGSYRGEVLVNGVPVTSPYGAPFLRDSYVTLTAVPDLGYILSDWSWTPGATRYFAFENPFQVKMDRDWAKDWAISANFTTFSYELFLFARGGGEIVVEGEEKELPWTGDYSFLWPVDLTAVPAEGWYFHRWEGDAYGGDEKISIVMQESRTAAAVFSPCMDLGEVLEGEALSWVGGGESGWCGLPSDDFPDGDGARSGTISDGRESWMGTTVAGPAQLSFRWKVSSEEHHDYLGFSIDGQAETSISGETSWTERTVSLPAGNHVLRWTYEKDQSASSGEDRGWVDSVGITPVYALSVTGSGSGSLLVDGSAETLPWTGTYEEGRQVVLESLPAAGWSFSHWTGDLSGSPNPATVSMDADTSGSVVFAPDPPTRGDWDGDNHADIVWRNYETGENYLWYMNGTECLGGDSLPALPDTAWRIGCIADYNGDANPDILWRNTATGDNHIWYMNGTAFAGSEALSAVPDLSWTVAGGADFDGSGSPDILWRNSATGANHVWYMNGTSFVGSAALPSVHNLDWTIAGTTDFDGSGTPDILWRNSATGENYIWYMNGIDIVGGVSAGAVSGSGWSVESLCDRGGKDGPDLLWRNSLTGDNYLWYMDGASVTGSAPIPSVSNTVWEVEE